MPAKAAQHTPGPWTIRPVFIAQKDSQSLHFGEYALNLWGIAGRSTRLNTSPTLPRCEAEANALLMAAAPELLEALENLTALIGNDLVRNTAEDSNFMAFTRQSVRIVEVLKQAESLLARLKGGE